ncbi:hypothetical protein J7L18_03815, partial [Candidatus Bathyarchaeota archaeon]|nr:hypothetical protein [Candidatus Bathyarchaeota archaeon]
SIGNHQCPKCKLATLRIAEKTEIIEDLARLAEISNANVEMISTETEEGQMLWKAFGGIAAILRYKIQT